jgi:hypothetical protein
VFCYDNAGTPTLEFLVWTNDTTRATALAYQDGVLCKAGALTRRYMGTFYTTSTTETEDSVTKRYLWNYYHRVKRALLKVDATASWNYTTATWRQANGSAANKVEAVIGVSEDMVSFSVLGSCLNTTGGIIANIGIGLNTTSGTSSSISSPAVTNVANQLTTLAATFEGYLAAGRNYLAWVEYSAATGTTTWYGTQGASYSGISGSVMS